MDAGEMTRETFERLIDLASVTDGSLTRRRFLQVGGLSVVGLSALGAWLSAEAAPPVLVLPRATGLVLADPTKCVGCRRCELACTEFNDGKAAPSMARIKVARNANFGPKGVYAGQRGQGNWGNGLIAQDLCKQCPHPVPCATACPNDAIIMEPKTKARMVDSKKCVGCQICQKA